LFTLGSFIKNTEAAHIFGLLFPLLRLVPQISTKMYWATFWAIIHKEENMCRVLSKLHSSPQFGGIFPLLRLCTNFDKSVLGYILGVFFTNSSGHPDFSEEWKKV
jgi:hypothetical protein